MANHTMQQKLQTLYPELDLQMYQQQEAYRNKVLALCQQQQVMLQAINQEFGLSKTYPVLNNDEKDFVLGYN